MGKKKLSNLADRTVKYGPELRALASHQCITGSILELGVICGLSLLVLYSALRGFSQGTQVFPYLQKPTFDLRIVKNLNCKAFFVRRI